MSTSSPRHNVRHVSVSDLTGRTVLLAAEDVEKYALHLSRHQAEYLPLTEAEIALVQEIADCNWNLRDVIETESGIYALGQLEFVSYFDDQPHDVRQAMIKAQTHLTYGQQLHRLASKEARLLRAKEKAIKVLKGLKDNRPQSPAGVAADIAGTLSQAMAASVSHSQPSWHSFDDAFHQSTVLTSFVPHPSQHAFVH